MVGALLWVAHRLATGPELDAVVVSAPTVSALRSAWQAQHGRPPSAEELTALVDEHVEQELLVREARAQGLDLADPIVRRRLIQKMQFVLEEAEPIEDPGDEVLEAWLTAHADAHRRPPRRGFTHAFVAGQGTEAEARAHALARQLERGDDPATLGDPFAHGHVQGPADHDALVRRYGEPLAQAVAAAPRDRVVVARSSFGWHALRIEDERPGRLPALAEIRARVLADWQQQRRADNLARGVAALRERAVVEVEAPVP
ncbi:peptidylprolyl isomerase [Paraliomyxa miuraensis]|uniref:peptidylprolyl isomerase n=1 Tax=Paraliomyxa miuraensis TaxID=376150 RepID=UPI002251E19E|nr:peptidylprolyl isomerase [Paraliomyxa miuraensis]MCX4240033.1 peptidylprolyl isomerase [Paraliomyxa miuraensis]